MPQPPTSPRRFAGIAGSRPAGDRERLRRLWVRKTREHAARERGGTYRPTKGSR